jgi:DNA-binding beta-propeller fold protein YncE
MFYPFCRIGCTRFLLFFLATLPFGAALQAQTGALDPPLILTADGRFPGHGGSTTFTITGPPNATYRLEAADLAAERTTVWGTHFIDLNSDFLLAAGTLSALGEATVVVAHPADAEFEGQLRYFQARGKDGLDRGLSNSIAVRFSDPPSGPRQPEAIAVSADGTTAFVAHEEDGTVSVIDAINDTLLFDMPVTIDPPSIGQPLDLHIDPEGRHAFLVDPRLRTIAVIDVASASIAGELPVPGASRSVAFSFVGNRRKVYVTNERDNSLLIFREQPLGKFSLLDTVPLEGTGPGPIVVLPDRNLLIGHRASLELEVIDEDAPVPTVARIPLGSLPLDIVTAGGKAFVPTFTQFQSGPDGQHELLEISLSTNQVVGGHLIDTAIDYLDAAMSTQHLVLVGAGSGTVVIADRASLATLDVIELAPGEPAATPQRGAFVPHSVSGFANKLYLINHFRETVRPIDLSGSPPFALLPEIALAHSGLPRVPMVDLTDVENGEWLFNSVEFFNGTSTTPNLVTCTTCHPHGFSDAVNSPDGLQAQPIFDAGTTATYGWAGNVNTLHAFSLAAFNKHGVVGGGLDPTNHTLMDLVQEAGFPVPASPFLEGDGSMSTAAQAGQLVFEGAANCSSCHSAPLFIPEAPSPRTITDGVGTGLAPANVPSLRGLWASPPYLFDGSAATLMDVLLLNVTDEHGTTSTLTQQELDDLVAYLLSL